MNLLRRLMFAVLVAPITFIGHVQAAVPESAWVLLPGTSRAVPDLPARRSFAIAAQAEILARAPQQILLPMPWGAVSANTRDIELHAEDRFTWRGSLDAKGEYPVVLSVAGEAVAGFISAPEGIWEIVPGTAAGEAWLIELDAAQLPECAGPVVVEPLQTATGHAPGHGPAGSMVPLDSGEQIDVLLMYSPAARDAAGGVNQIRAQAQAAVTSGNSAFANSAMRARFRVVGIELLEDWVEGAESASGELSKFRANARMQARRTALAADMASLLVANLPNSCGIAYVMRNVSAGFASNAVQITDRDCAVGNLSWAHEHGHNMGFEHDPANGGSPSSASYPWSFGHYVEGQGAQSFRTVMSYQCPTGGCTRRPYFSNPRVNFKGFATGIVNARDNARSGDGVADTVANFRLSQQWPGFADSFEQR